MPIQVDVERRTADIAEATFRVAAREGLGALTLRAVAAELGASTTSITNYLPTRFDLLVNAVDRLGEEWRAELEDVLADHDGEAALREIMRRAVSWDSDELLRCQFWVAVLAAPHRSSDLDHQLFDSEQAIRDLITKVVEQCDIGAPHVAADVLYLFAQGVFSSIVESPGVWTVARLQAAADRLVTALLD
jgi:AcrR family transcriptional regulator